MRSAVRSTRRSTRLIRAAAVAVAGVLVLAGCNDSDSAADSADAMTPVAAIQKVADNASNDSATYTFEMSGAGISVKGAGAYRGGDNPAARMTFEQMKALGFSLPAGMEFRLVDDVMYVKTSKGGLLPGVGDGGWVKMPVDDVQGEGATIAGLDPMMADPREQLEKMLDTEDVTKVGTETVDGVRTTHYRAKISPEGTGTVTEKKSSTHSNELSRQLEEELENSIRDSMGLSEPVTVDAWVDEDYRARKMAVAMPMFGEVKMTMKFSDFGSDVQVEAPADAQPFDVGDVLNQALDSAAGDEIARAMGEGFSTDLSERFAGELARSLGEDFSANLSEEFAQRLREHMERMDSGAGRAS